LLIPYARVKREKLQKIINHYEPLSHWYHDYCHVYLYHFIFSRGHCFLMKWNKKYKYAGITRTEEHGSRLYDVLGIRLPSVTTVLSRTKDQSYLDKWKA
jgi:hypothetical protein